MAKRGKPSMYSPAAEADFRRMWETTLMSHSAIARELSVTHGLHINPDRLPDHAKRRGFYRPPTKDAPRTQDRIMEIATLRRLAVPPADRVRERVALVPPGTHAVRGYTMIGGR